MTSEAVEVFEDRLVGVGLHRVVDLMRELGESRGHLLVLLGDLVDVVHVERGTVGVDGVSDASVGDDADLVLGVHLVMTLEGFFILFV